MTDDEKHTGGRVDAEFRRQMRSGQMSRFVSTLSHYAVNDDLPDRFVKLLRQIDSLPDDERRSSHTASARKRQN